MIWGGYGDEDWLGFEWSRWISLRPSDRELKSLPMDEGLYRIRHLERSGLEYIGETGRSLRGRVRALARGTYADEMPYREKDGQDGPTQASARAVHNDGQMETASERGDA